jgi:hypothetical protein
VIDLDVTLLCIGETAWSNNMREDDKKWMFIKKDINNNVMCKYCMYAVPMHEGASTFACEHPKYIKYNNINEGSYICGYGIKWL